MTEQEIWKPVVGFEQSYEVSNLGNIRNKKNGRVRRIDYATNYPTVLLSVDGEHKTFRVHRLVAKAFLEPVEGKNHVNHKNGNHSDNRVCNLEWCTQSENNLHAYRVLHRKPPMLGKTAANRKVNNKDILLFNQMNLSGTSTEEIGKFFGIDGSTVRKHLRKYRHDQQLTATNSVH